jgi:hypothetical protein
MSKLLLILFILMNTAWAYREEAPYHYKRNLDKFPALPTTKTKCSDPLKILPPTAYQAIFDNIIKFYDDSLGVAYYDYEPLRPFCIEGDCQEGYGILKDPNYPWYYGYWHKGYYHGKGILYVNPYLTFDGFFENGHPHKGTYYEKLWVCVARYKKRSSTFDHSSYNKDLAESVAKNKCERHYDFNRKCNVKCEQLTKKTEYDRETNNVNPIIVDKNPPTEIDENYEQEYSENELLYSPK